MTINQSEVLSLVKTRLQLKDDTHDALIDSYVQEIEQRILHYCNLQDVPDGLKFTWASMVMDAVRVELSSVGDIADTADRGENIKIGDTSTSPAQQSGVTNTSKAVIDSVVLNYRIDLNRYRRLRW